MNELTVFNNEEFGEIRTITIDGEPWFVGKDVADVLGYSNSSKAILTHVDSEDKTFLMMDIADSQNGNVPIGQTKTAIINESGLYSLIISSKLPNAKAFKRWVTADILPAIRKTGGYMTDELLAKCQKDPNVMFAFAEELLKLRDKTNALESKLDVAQPKADFYDTFVSPNKCTGLRDTAKELGISERKFVNFLIDEKYLYRTPARQLRPYAKKSNEGLFETKDWYTKSDIVSVRVFFTPQGKQFFYKKLIEKGLIGAPMVCA
jgi:prophage antirepressor-like protein|nr:MAG TPA_asm: repressor domain protein [Caudoviricetes sp.]